MSVSASIYLRVLCKIHVFGFMSQHLPISGFSARSMCPIHVLAFMSQHLCISGSSARSMSRFMSQHLCISGFSTRSMSSDSCLSIIQHPLIWILYKIHVFGLMSQHPYVSQDSLQDPCLRIHVSASTNMDPLQDPRLWAHVSAFLYLRLLCKIHVSGSVYKQPYVSQDPLQDPCLRIRI